MRSPKLRALAICLLSFISQFAQAQVPPTAWVEIDKPFLEPENNILRIPLRGTPGLFCRIEVSNDPVANVWRIAPFSLQLPEGTVPMFVNLNFLNIDKPVYIRAVVTLKDETLPF